MLHKQKHLLKVDNYISKDIDYITTIFNHYNYEIYLVGGCVRDLILNKVPNDYDFCTSATPKEIKKMFETRFIDWHLIETGLKHGTITLFNPDTNNSFEITTFRIEGVYLDNRRPDSVEFVTSLEEDLRRRDFTINSLAYDFHTEELIMLDESYLLDLEYKIIKGVGDPNERFKEDALRMMRAIRFSAQLNASIAVETFSAIRLNAPRISNVSTERIRDELTKIIMSDNPEHLKLLIDSRLTRYILQELDTLHQSTQKNEYHHTDVFHHTLEVMKAVPKDDLVLRLAALYHDIGKRSCSLFDDKGQEHHYGHEEYSATFANRRLRELKFDNDTVDKVVTLIAAHGYPLEGATQKMSALKRLVRKVGEGIFPQYLMLRHADAIAHSVEKAGRLDAQVANTKEMYQTLILTKQPLSLKDLAINGHDVMLTYGKSGKDVGTALNYALEHVIEHPEDNTTEKLLKLLKDSLKGE